MLEMSLVDVGVLQKVDTAPRRLMLILLTVETLGTAPATVTESLERVPL